MFLNDAIGLRAVVSLLSTNTYQALTIDDAINRYTPPAENNTANYQILIQQCTGSPGDTQTNILTADQLNGVAGAIGRVEGWHSGEVAYFEPDDE